MKRLLVVVFLAVVAVSFGSAGQSRVPGPTIRHDPFECLRHEAESSAVAKLRVDQRAEEARSSALADLQQKLPMLIGEAQELQNWLDKTDLRAKLPADLAKRAAEIEQLARKINKTVRGL